jgi:hypothetical protein
MPTNSPSRLNTLSLLCYVYAAVLLVTIMLFVRLYNNDPYADDSTRTAYVYMMFSQLPVAIAVLLMYQRKMAGLWIFLMAKIFFFVLPSLLGKPDLLGLATPVFFMESAVFFVLFGMQFKKRTVA